MFTDPPRQDQIDTIEEIVESKLPIGKWKKSIEWKRTQIESEKYNRLDDENELNLIANLMVMA